MSDYDSDLRAKNDEIEYLSKTITKLRKSAESHIVFLGIGVLIVIIGFIYLAINPDIVSGSLTLAAIGIGIIIYNALMRKSNLKELVN